MIDKPLFHSKTGFQFSGVSEQQLLNAREALKKNYGINLLQIAEASSYSLAMVIRFALGLSAAGGKVCIITNDSLAGQVGLACVRHLCNAGSEAVVIPLSPVSTASEEFKAQLNTLNRMNVRTVSAKSIAEIGAVMENSHNVIFALYGGSISAPFQMDELVERLNEERTPIHCIEIPYGVNPDTGKAEDTPLYASSTLSLGAPLKGLYWGNEYVGRHYICDISLTAELYQSMGDNLAVLFCDQPVVQIFPSKTDE